MSLTASIVASGSSGNCIWLSDETTAIVVDAGISRKRMADRLLQQGNDLDAVAAICLTHEHEDHVRGIQEVQKRYATEIYANGGTVEGYLASHCEAAISWKIFQTGQPFTVGTLAISSFPVSHDGYEPVGYLITNASGLKIGVVTDLGISTNTVVANLHHCDGIIIESNHDVKLLEQSPRPPRIKRRIMSPRGHLSNRQAADLVASVASVRLQYVCLSHLSLECNYPELALDETRRALRLAGHRHVEVFCHGNNNQPVIFKMTTLGE
jgi:phosphoribosyl 1,2-cyclic phosphodiesterase